MAETGKDGFLTTADGPKLHFRDYEPARTMGCPVLCLHGLTRNLKDFEELAERISQLGRRAITMSQRGRGRSERDPVAERYNPAVYTTDALALLNHLGISEAVFIGTSMGGLMTMIACAQAPSRVAGAVLNDVGPEIDPTGLERIRGYVGGGRPATSWNAAALQCRAINAASFPNELDDAFWLAFARRTYREETPGRIVLDYDPAIARSIAPPPAGTPAASLWPLFDAMAKIPTLVVRGELSDILMTSTMEEMRRRKPDLVVANVPDVGHAPFLTEPDAWSALRDFLAAH